MRSLVVYALFGGIKLFITIFKLATVPAFRRLAPSFPPGYNFCSPRFPCDLCLNSWFFFIIRILTRITWIASRSLIFHNFTLSACDLCLFDWNWHLNWPFFIFSIFSIFFFFFFFWIALRNILLLNISIMSSKRNQRIIRYHQSLILTIRNNLLAFSDCGLSQLREFWGIQACKIFALWRKFCWINQFTFFDNF